MYHIHDTTLSAHEENHYLLARTVEMQRRCLFRAKLYPTLDIVRAWVANASEEDTCIVYSSFPSHELGRMLMEEEIPFRFIHNESTARDIQEAATGGVILLGPKIPLRFDVRADTVISLDMFMNRAETGRLSNLSVNYFIVMAIPAAGKEKTVDAHT